MTAIAPYLLNATQNGTGKRSRDSRVQSRREARDTCCTLNRVPNKHPDREGES